MNKIIDNLQRSKSARAAYWIAVLFSVALFTTGFFIPPVGEISGSVLIACGSVMLFTLGYIAVAYRANVKIGVDIDDRKVTLSTAREEEECHD